MRKYISEIFDIQFNCLFCWSLDPRPLPLEMIGVIGNRIWFLIAADSAQPEKLFKETKGKYC